MPDALLASKRCNGALGEIWVFPWPFYVGICKHKIESTETTRISKLFPTDPFVCPGREVFP